MAVQRESALWRPYDFRRPYQLSKLQVEALNMVSESYSRAVSNFMTGYLRTAASLSLQAVEQVPYEDYAASVPSPSVLHVFSHPPDPGTALAQFDIDVAMVVLDRALGGPGVHYHVRRELTEIERAVFMRFSQRLLDLYAQAWSAVVSFRIKVEATEFNPAFTQIVGQGDLVVVVRFLLQVDDTEGQFALVWPYSAIRPYANALASHAWAREGDVVQTRRSDVIERQLYQTPVALTALLGSARLTLKEFSQIQPGHVVVLNRRHDDPIEVEVDGVDKFLAVPGRHRGNVAVRLLGRKEMPE
jgi:flagellar motor switch protein FliM